jgi:hypothetical protein
MGSGNSISMENEDLIVLSIHQNEYFRYGKVQIHITKSILLKRKVKRSLYSSGQAQSVPGV